MQPPYIKWSYWACSAAAIISDKRRPGAASGSYKKRVAAKAEYLPELTFMKSEGYLYVVGAAEATESPQRLRLVGELLLLCRLKSK